MSDTDLDQGVPWGTIIWGLFALALLLWLVGLTGILHLAKWALIVAFLFALGMAAIALIMRIFD